MNVPIPGNDNLRAIAHQVMQEEGFEPDFPPKALAEAQALDSRHSTSTNAAPRDLRSLLWSSIDNSDSRDLDQLEVAEQQPDGAIRLLIAIADVDAYVPAGSAIDRHAAVNVTSVYTGITTFPMLPERLSTDLTSLVESGERLAIVVDFLVRPDGTVESSSVYQALVRNQAKLDYETIGAWLEGNDGEPAKFSTVAELEDQIRLQDEAAERLHDFRQRRGALDLETIEASVIASDGAVMDLVVKHKNRARYLIESLMIAANGIIAAFLETSNSPSIERVVRTPERWSRIVELAATYGYQLPAQPDAPALDDFLLRSKAADPLRFPDLSLAVVKLIGAGEYVVGLPDGYSTGHFGLAVQDYTHATAPNRRYVDLVTQRLIKAVLAQQPSPYTLEELGAIASHCNERDKAAKKVERRMRKYAAVALMASRVGTIFDAIVTGASEKGTYARLLVPPVEGRIVRGERGLDVGDKVRVKLVSVDAERGFIDFERI